MTEFTLHSDRSLNKVAACLVALLSILPCMSKAGEGSATLPHHPLTLRGCVAIALGESPALEASRFDVFSADQAVRAAQGMLLPQITGGADYLLFSGSRVSKFGVINLGSVSPNGSVVTASSVGSAEVELYSAHLKYPLFADGSILGLNNAPAVAEKKAKKQALAWTVNLTREEVIYRITDEFVTTVSARNRMGLAERRVKLLDQKVSITQKQQKHVLKLLIYVNVARKQSRVAKTRLTRLLEQVDARILVLS